MSHGKFELTRHKSGLNYSSVMTDLDKETDILGLKQLAIMSQTDLQANSSDEEDLHIDEVLLEVDLSKPSKRRKLQFFRFLDIRRGQASARYHKAM